MLERRKKKSESRKQKADAREKIIALNLEL